MGFDCSYQGIPESSEVIQKAIEDADFAEDVFYSLIAFSSNLEKKDYFKDKEFSEVRNLFRIHPEIKLWNFSPSSRMHDALIYCLNPDTFENSKNHEDLQSTFPYKFVKGQKVFCEHLRSPQGVHVRISPSNFIIDCDNFSKSFDLSIIRKNYNQEKMTSIGVYKIFPHSDVKYIEEYFQHLCHFYSSMRILGNNSVFIIED